MSVYVFAWHIGKFIGWVSGPLLGRICVSLIASGGIADPPADDHSVAQS